MRVCALPTGHPRHNLSEVGPDTHSQYGRLPQFDILSVSTPTLSPAPRATVSEPVRASALAGEQCLAQLTPGEQALVAEVNADAADAVRLKSLGICVGRRVQLVKSGDPLVVRVLGARVGISARLARGIFIRTL